MTNKGGVSDRWYDSLSMHYIGKESCHLLSETNSYIVHKTCVKITEWGRFFGLNVHVLTDGCKKFL